MNAARVSAERIAEIRRLYLERDPTHKIESIAIECETSVDSIGKYCADLPRRNPHQEKQRLAVIELASLGNLALDEIAKHAGCSIRFARQTLAASPGLTERS